ncbi:MAG: hypothetical protein QOI78_5950, partial [Actinomycetota bacterium]|nr:hypothetical protein [Actinomycetota bacterium]
MALSCLVPGASGPFAHLRQGRWCRRTVRAVEVRGALSRRKGCERPLYALGQRARVPSRAAACDASGPLALNARVRVARSCRWRREWPFRAAPSGASGPPVLCPRVRVARSWRWRASGPFVRSGRWEWVRVGRSCRRGLARAARSRREGVSGPFARLGDQREWPARAAKGASGPFMRWRRAEWPVRARADASGPFGALAGSGGGASGPLVPLRARVDRSRARPTSASGPFAPQKARVARSQPKPQAPEPAPAAGSAAPRA